MKVNEQLNKKRKRETIPFYILFLFFCFGLVLTEAGVKEEKTYITSTDVQTGG